MAIFSLSALIEKSITIGNETIPVDAISRVSQSSTTTVTQHPVEQGFNISDAQHQMPIAVTFQAWITDNAQSMFSTRAYAELPNITGISIVEGHVKKQLEKLEREKNNGGLVTIKTKYAKYTDYYCLSFDYEETTRSGILINISIMEKQDNADDNRATAFFDTDTIGFWS